MRSGDTLVTSPMWQKSPSPSEKRRGRYGLPLEHRHAGAEAGGGCNRTRTGEVLAEDGVAAVVDGCALTAERADEHAGTVDAARVVRAGGCVGEADAGFKVADELRKIEQKITSNDNEQWDTVRNLWINTRKQYADATN